MHRDFDNRRHPVGVATKQWLCYILFHIPGKKHSLPPIVGFPGSDGAIPHDPRLGGAETPHFARKMLASSVELWETPGSALDLRTSDHSVDFRVCGNPSAGGNPGLACRLHNPGVDCILVGSWTRTPTHDKRYQHASVATTPWRAEGAQISEGGTALTACQ